MNTDAIVRLLIFLVIPAFMMGRAYKKMSKEERNEVKGDFTSVRFLTSIGLIQLSLVFLLIEPFFKISLLKTISGVLFSIGIIVSIIRIWLKATSKSIALLRILLLVSALTVFFWAL
ncbi:hypothetical protein JFL43_03515 [Viridibacillus sp. YIM B01967]|uniref:DUF4181 domain-containing protein n=1 Tax=Viridibacillus soli TaxID=2798301 RepID=A0ABS1H3F3_9BACL|nr:hypothetical protein [Viridibacillus soli]MBK3493940.1 hypothetical protein [Viridibacillus soli]